LLTPLKTPSQLSSPKASDKLLGTAVLYDYVIDIPNFGGLQAPNSAVNGKHRP
jgi:hypothetical protein